MNVNGSFIFCQTVDVIQKITANDQSRARLTSSLSAEQLTQTYPAITNFFFLPPTQTRRRGTKTDASATSAILQLVVSALHRLVPVAAHVEPARPRRRKLLHLLLHFAFHFLLLPLHFVLVAGHFFLGLPLLVLDQHLHCLLLHLLLLVRNRLLHLHHLLLPLLLQRHFPLFEFHVDLHGVLGLLLCGLVPHKLFLVFQLRLQRLQPLLHLLFQHLVVRVLLLLNLGRIRQSAARDTRRPLLRHLGQVREVLKSWWRKL
mmetsp:Transcript_19055/g.47679  ORF Transcript_19055/g.47679 Transcript_19055/m.47679 type:complete len:259 (-) Transcript_19055:124-900(-)